MLRSASLGGAVLVLAFTTLATAAADGKLAPEDLQKAVKNATRNVLRGLEGFYLHVAVKGGKELGIDEEQTRIGVEAALRKSRLPLVDDDQKSKTPAGFATLSVALDAMPLAKSSGIYLISVRMIQGAALPHRPKEHLYLVTTWSTVRFGFAGPSQARIVEEAITGAMDEFINDYLAANPGK